MGGTEGRRDVQYRGKIRGLEGRCEVEREGGRYRGKEEGREGRLGSDREGGRK